MCGAPATAVGPGPVGMTKGFHHQRGWTCGGCGADFVQHWESHRSPAAEWFAHDGRLVKGVATCCANSLDRPCQGCGGWQAHASKLRGEAVVGVVEATPFGVLPAMAIESFTLKGDGSPAVPHQPMFWRCRSCGRTDQDERYPSALEA